jgi:hypothetical protein
LEGPGDLAETHSLEFAVAKALEEALGGADELLGGGPFEFEVLVGAAGPVGDLLAAEGSLGLDLLLEEAGVEGADAVGPAVFAGPVLDRVEALVQLIGHGLVRALLAEVEESQEGIEGAGGLAGEGGERELRVES